MEWHREPRLLGCGAGQEREWFWEMQGELMSSLSRSPTLQGKNIESGYGSVFVKKLELVAGYFPIGK